MSNKEVENHIKPFNLQEKLFLIENFNTEISAASKRINKDITYVRDFKEQRNVILEEVQGEIKSGRVTTGDKIKDFAIVYLGAQEDREKQLYDLENQLKKHKGEFVLLKKIESVAHGHIDFGYNSRKPHPELYHWEKRVQIGVIDEKTPLAINIKNGKLTIASKKHFYINEWHDAKAFMENEPICLQWWELTEIGKSLESVHSNLARLSESIYPTAEQINSQGIKDPAVEIIVGNKNVWEYLKLTPDICSEISKGLGKRTLKQGSR